MGDCRQSALDTAVFVRLKGEIRRFIYENFLFGDEKAVSLSDTDSFLGKGIIDSTGILELVTHLEEAYGIHVEDDEMIPENLDSIHNVATFILRKRENDSDS